MKKGLVIFLTLILSSCTTYYQKNLKFNQYFLSGQLEEAYHLLSSDKKKHRKDKLIVLLNKGVVASMLGKYEESNTYFEEAYRLADDIQKNYLNEGVALLTNPNMVPYKGEDFEILFIHYYKALNFLKLNEKEKALVECKRMNIELNQLNDKYKSDRKYQRDAFIHLLMGVIYDANQDYNNAFIAYRNALEIYQQDYKKMFGLGAPEQLKKDLFRTAHLSGFYEEVSYFEKQLGMKYIPEKKKDAEMVFLWQNGLGPVKSEWSINFAIVKGQGGNVFFVNNELGLSFPFPMSDNDYKSSGLSDLQFIRVAFPRYIERSPFYDSARLTINGSAYQLEKAEDVGEIAKKSLHDRMLLELGKTLLRFALKKAAEIQVRQQNQNIGAAVGLLNAISEKADTRQWQTLPNEIYYSRVPLEKGNQEIKFTTIGKGSEKTHTINYEVVPGATYFHTYHSLETTGDPVRF